MISLGYFPFPLLHSNSETVITILIFTIGTRGPMLCQKEFPVNEVVIKESCISGRDDNY